MEPVIHTAAGKRKPRRSIHDYTIAWISALPIEHAAAVGLLDEEHESLPAREGDPSIYTLGMMAGHNVVIGSLPAGLLGIATAAGVARRLGANFPKIRSYFMTGIAGGIPSENADIRLGDVVVSQPQDGFGGVVQYDFGKALADSSYRSTKHLNRPPDLLLNALFLSQSAWLSQRSRFHEFLAVLQKNEVFLGQRADADILFNANYPHVGGSSCVNCDPSQIIQRQQRASDKKVQVHYGTIASGNTVMKDAVQRDAIRGRLGDSVLCFEMEAAGLMEEFPCLVVRGICDYADSHKNKVWQPYAAATAAAYAKELMSWIPTSTCSEFESDRAKPILTGTQTAISRGDFSNTTLPIFPSSSANHPEESALSTLPKEYGAWDLSDSITVHEKIAISGDASRIIYYTKSRALVYSLHNKEQFFGSASLTPDDSIDCAGLCHAEVEGSTIMLHRKAMIDPRASAPYYTFGIKTLNLGTKVVWCPEWGLCMRPQLLSPDAQVNITWDLSGFDVSGPILEFRNGAFEGVTFRWELPRSLTRNGTGVCIVSGKNGAFYLVYGYHTVKCWGMVDHAPVERWINTFPYNYQNNHEPLILRPLNRHTGVFIKMKREEDLILIQRSRVTSMQVPRPNELIDVLVTSNESHLVLLHECMNADSNTGLSISISWAPIFREAEQRALGADQTGPPRQVFRIGQASQPIDLQTKHYPECQICIACYKTRRFHIVWIATSRGELRRIRIPIG